MARKPWSQITGCAVAEQPESTLSSGRQRVDLTAAGALAGEIGKPTLVESSVKQLAAALPGAAKP